MTIAIVGSGNVAAHLAKHLIGNGHRLVGLHSRNKKTGQAICAQHGIPFVEEIQNLMAEVIFICVKDDAIEQVSLQIIDRGNIVVHCSGSTDIDVIKQKHKGVFYPLQTFTATTPISFSQVPILISASDLATMEVLKNIAISLSETVKEVDDEKRLVIHLAAVVVNNFTNHLAVKVKSLLEEHQLDYALLQPLMETTFEKLTKQPYNFQQTGPAKRGDEKVLTKHMALIQKDESLLAIYKAMTSSIQEIESHLKN